MTCTELLMIIAIFSGPIIAIQLQKLIERVTRKRDEKRKLFMTLLATRSRKMLPEHVQALNMIHVVYSSKKGKKEKKKDKAVVEAWDVYRDQLNSGPEEPKLQDNEEAYKADIADFQNLLHEWAEKSDEHFCNLLKKMAESLGYHFSELWLKKGAYTPQGYGEWEENQRTILSGLAKVFLGIRPFPMKVCEFPADEKTNKAMMQFIQGKQTLPVRMESLDKTDKDNKSEEPDTV